MIRLLIPLLALIFLAACATPGPSMPAPVVPDLPGAQATYLAAVQKATAEAVQLTAIADVAASAATATAEAVRFDQSSTTVAQAAHTQATADSLAVRSTQIAQEMIIADATRIAHPTMTADAQAALVAQRLIDDESRRLENQRHAEMIGLQRDAAWNATFPFLIAAATLLVLIAAFVAARMYWLRAQPVVITYANERPQTLVHSEGAWRVIAAPARRLLPAPVDDDIIDGETRPIAIPLPRIERGHVMIVGVTGDGKSMALRELVDHRPNVTVLDPHNTPGAWGDCRVIGGGSDYDAILSYMHWLQEELVRRSQSRATGLTHFDPITIATEEMPAIIDQGGQQIGAIWRRVMREGRKFGLFMIVVTQSTRVATLGIKGEGDLLECFNYIVLLGSVAAKEYPDLVRGISHPAVIRNRHNPPQSVIIPYDPRRDPESDQFQRPYHTANPYPAIARDEPTGMATEGGFVTAAEIDRIINHDAEGCSRREISRRLYATDGGAGYLRVKGVLDALVGAIT